jgi:DNA-directed RNA polymerase specialized sigma24 family protein
MTFSLSGDARGEDSAAPAPFAEPRAKLTASPAAPYVAVIFRQHHAQLVRLALMLVGDRPTAEDVVQDAFAGLHARRDRLRPDGDTALVASAEHDVLLAEDRKRVLTALAALPRRRQEVLILRYYLDLSVDEVAATLRISPGTVKSTAARGLATLASSLGEES